MAEPILVTGGTGFTGSHLVRALVADGQPVRVLARSAGRARDVLPPEVEVVEGDVVDAGAVQHAMRGRAVVYHLATTFRQAGIPDARHRAVHVEGTRLLLEAARAEGVRRFVHCSTVGVHSHIERPPADESWPHTPGDIYQQTKSEAEILALDFGRRHGLAVTVARPSTIYGPGDLRLLKMFRMLAKGRFVMLGNGKPFLHMVYVDDLVRGLRLMAERPEAVGEVFILAGGEYGSLAELAELIARLLDAPRPRLRLPAWPFFLAGALCEAVCVPLGVEPPIYRRRVAFFTKSRAFNIEKARRVLGYQPRVGLEEGLRRCIDWYRAQGHLPAGAPTTGVGAPIRL